MNASTLKILVPLALLIAVVFAVTFFSQYTPNDPVELEGATGGGSTEKPLEFFTNTRVWNPVSSDSLQNRTFPGFYKADGTQQTTTFWFRNSNPKPVAIQLERASCTSCSGASVAALPPDATRFLLQTAAVAALPQGPVAGLPAALAAPAANLYREDGPLAKRSALWQRHQFVDRDPAEIVYHVPAAADPDGWSPQWGVLEMNFVPKTAPQSVHLTTWFKTWVEGSGQVVQETFNIGYECVPPFEVDRPLIDVGDLTDASPQQTHEFLVYSSTDAEMPDLTVRVMMPPGTAGDPGGFISTGRPVPVPEAEHDDLAVSLSRRLGKPVRVRSAYRVPVTVKVRDGNAKLDIGRVVRVVWITQGSEQKQVTVLGVMRGSVYLKGMKEVSLGNFPYKKGTTATVTVVSERREADLAVAPALTRPKYLQVGLKKLPDRGGTGEYELTVKVPEREDAAIGEITDGAVVLEVRGPNPQRIRIPVKGKGQR